MSKISVKICGVTRVEDARLAAELGADYLGLNFFAASPRVVEPERAAEIARAVRGRLAIVGVFVNESRERIEAIADTVPLDLIQLHGDEGPEEVAAVGRRAIKVFRVREDFDPDQVSAYATAGAFLFDCGHPSLYGGTGLAWPYERIAGLDVEQPVWVAGGIAPENVRQAIQLSGADGIDVCSGVESSPGVKDHDAMKRLFQEVRHGEEGT
ncbi:MAG: phosphoribosylanthranilate isomerase [Thermoanaerobaculia bacterium]